MRFDLGGCYLEVRLIEKGRRGAGSRLDSHMVTILSFMVARGFTSQRELAQRLGVREWTLSKTLRGHRKNPALIKKLAQVLEVPPELIRAA